MTPEACLEAVRESHRIQDLEDLGRAVLALGMAYGMLDANEAERRLIWARVFGDLQEIEPLGSMRLKRCGAHLTRTAEIDHGNDLARSDYARQNVMAWILYFKYLWPKRQVSGCRPGCTE